jgi:hypothetical protein
MALASGEKIDKIEKYKTPTSPEALSRKVLFIDTLRWLTTKSNSDFQISTIYYKQATLVGSRKLSFSDKICI